MTHTSAPTFSTVRFMEGYDIDEVDSFIRDVEPQVAGNSPDAELAHRITAARFTPVRMRRGYDMREVDAYLDQLVERAFTGRGPT